MSRRLVPLLVLAVAAGPLVAQQPPTRPTFDNYRATIDNNLRLYTDPAIQAELKLTDEQKAKLDKLTDDLLAKHKEAIDKQKAAEKDAAEKEVAVRDEIQKKYDAVVEKHLTADQRKRLNQMAIQAMGTNAFFNPEVVKGLALSEDAVDKLFDIEEAGLGKLQTEFPNWRGGFGRPGGVISEEQKKYAEASQKMARDTVAQFVDTLSAEQKKKWKEMTGEPWDGTAWSVAARTTPPLGPSLGRLFPPITVLYWQNRLVGDAKVLDELKVEKAAREALAEGVKSVVEEVRAKGFSGGRFGSDSVAMTLAQDTTTAAAQVLTAPQARRLEQIRYQMNGTDLFSANGIDTIEFLTTSGGGMVANPRQATLNPVARLTLTPAQVVKIDAILADASKKQQDLGTLPRGLSVGFYVFDPAFRPTAKPTDAQKARAEESLKAQKEYLQKASAIDAKAVADIAATFDAGQKAVWAELTGEPFDVSKVRTRNRFSVFRGVSGGAPTPGIVTRWTREASMKTSRGEYAAALATYDEAIRLAPTSPLHRQSKARLLASCPSEWVRDGKRAVELMTAVMADTKEPTYAQYDVLAMAHAECGQFDEAVKAQQKAISLLPPPANPSDSGFGPLNLTPQYEARLKLYQEKKPYRTAPSPFVRR